MRSIFNITAILILIFAVVSTGLAQISSVQEHSIDSHQQAELQHLTFLSVKGKRIIDKEKRLYLTENFESSRQLRQVLKKEFSQAKFATGEREKRADYTGFFLYSETKSISIPSSGKWVFYLSTSNMRSVAKPIPETVFTVHIGGKFIGWREGINWSFKNGRRLIALRSYPLFLEKGTYTLVFCGDNKVGQVITIKALEYRKDSREDRVPDLKSAFKDTKKVRDIIFSPLKGFAHPGQKPFIEIGQNGDIIKGSEIGFPKFLHEKPRWQDRGKGPVILVDCPSEGIFALAVGRISKSPILKIIIDNKIVYNKKLDATDYKHVLKNGIPQAYFKPPKIISVPINKGKHEIKVENSSATGWILVNAYAFRDIFNQYEVAEVKEGMQWRVNVPTKPSKDHLIEVEFSANFLALGTVRVKDQVIGTFQGHDPKYGYIDCDDTQATYLFLIPGSLVDKNMTELVFSCKNRPIRIRKIQVIADKKFPITTPNFVPRAISKSLHIGSGGRYFVDENGVGQFLMGLALQFPTNEMDDHLFVPTWAWFWSAEIDTILRFLEKLALNGVNHIRIKLNQAHLEPYRGKYSEEGYAMFTTMLDRCRTLGIYATIALGDQQALTSSSRYHGQRNPILGLFPSEMRGEKMLKNTYRKEARQIFFANPAMKEYFRESIAQNGKYLRGRPEVMGIQLWSETHPTDREIVGWHNEMAGVTKKIIPEKPISTSIVVANPDGKAVPTLNDLSWSVKELSELSTVDFIEPSMHESNGYTQDSYYQTLRMLASSFNKPVVIGESDWFMNPEHTWQTLWATIMAGAAGIKIWGYLSDYHLYLFRPAAWLTRKIDFAKFQRPLVGDNKGGDGRVRAENKIRYLIDTKGEQALLWIEGEQGSLKISGMRGVLPCLWYDPWSGKIIRDESMKFDPLGTSLEMPGTGEKKKTVLYIGVRLH